jgi:hypothetical protein
MSNLIELVVEAEYLLKVARVCPVQIKKTKLIEDMARHYQVSKKMIREDFEFYTTDYFKSKDVQQKWDFYNQAKEKLNPNIGDDEALYIADLLTDDLTGLQHLNVELNGKSWEGDVRLTGVIFNHQKSDNWKTFVSVP